MKHKPDNFTAGGVEFSLHPLPVKVSRPLYKRLPRLAGPILAAMGDFSSTAARLVQPEAGDENEGPEEGASVEPEQSAGDQESIAAIGRALATVAPSFEELEDFQDAFAKHCFVKLDDVGNDNWLELNKFFDETFRRE